MIYRFGITTPANTTSSGKKRTDLKITAGIIHQLDIVFPPGPQGLLHVQINRGLYQIWPSNPDESFAADNDKISFPEHYEITNDPYRLEAYTWNDDDTYAHSLILRFGIFKRHKLTLYDKHNFPRKTDSYKTWLLAYSNGKDWTNIIDGNYFTINEEVFK